MAIDANNLYWTENTIGGVFQIAKGGGGVVTVKAPDNVNGTAWAVVTDSNGGGTWVYWTDRTNGRIGATTIGGGTPWYYASPKGSSAGTYGIAQGFVNGTDYVYGADFGASNVWYIDANARGGTGVAAFSVPSPTGLFDPGGAFLLIALYNGGTVQNSGTMIATGKNVDTRYVTSDGATAFWTASDGGQVWYAPVNASGATPTALSTGEAEPWGITTDGANSVYWVDKTSGYVRHAHLVSGAWAIDTLATGNNPTDIRVDGAAIYWAEFGSGQIMRLNK